MELASKWHIAITAQAANHLLGLEEPFVKVNHRGMGTNERPSQTAHFGAGPPLEGGKFKVTHLMSREAKTVWDAPPFGENIIDEG